MERLEKIMERIKLRNEMIDFMQNLPHNKIQSYFPLPNGDNTKKVQKIRNLLKDLSDNKFYFSLQRDLFCDYIIVRAVSVELCYYQFNKERKEGNLLINQYKKFSDKEIQQFIKLGQQGLEKISKLWKETFKKIEPYELRKYFEEELKYKLL